MRYKAKLGALHPAIDEAKRSSWFWDGQFKDWLTANGLGTYKGWDRLPYEKKAELEALWEQGHDNITADKIAAILGPRS